MKYRIKETGTMLTLIGSCLDVTVYNTKDVGYISSGLLKELGLTLEPIEDAPKKLYAIREIATGLINFHDVEKLLYQPNMTTAVKYERAPEYDIDYPLVKT